MLTHVWFTQTRLSPQGVPSRTRPWLGKSDGSFVPLVDLRGGGGDVGKILCENCWQVRFNRCCKTGRIGLISVQKLIKCAEYLFAMKHTRNTVDEQIMTIHLLGYTDCFWIWNVSFPIVSNDSPGKLENSNCSASSCWVWHKSSSSSIEFATVGTHFNSYTWHTYYRFLHTKKHFLCTQIIKPANCVYSKC